MEARRRDARVAAMVATHGEALRRVARRFSANAEDAEDAVQRGLEIYVRRLALVDPATELAWLKVVVRHEALAVARARGEVAGDVDLDAHPAPGQRSLEELVAGRERAGRVAEALRRLKPDEARALLLKADGLSYTEIGGRMGWSYTKVNRALTEGRKRFFELYGEIEAGDACDRAAPALAALAGGRADAGTLVELRPHLRHCVSCRATVRRMHARRRLRAAAVAPVPWLQGLAQRLQAADVVAGAQYAAAASGGGRVAALGAVAALCAGAPGTANCGPATDEAAGAPAAHAAAAHREPAPVAPGGTTFAAARAVGARRTSRTGAPGAEFAFEPLSRPMRAAARTEGRGSGGEAFGRGAAPAAGGGFERGGSGTTRHGFERDGDETATGHGVERSDRATATGRSFERSDRATATGRSFERSVRAAPAGHRTDAAVEAAPTAEGEPFERPAERASGGFERSAGPPAAADRLPPSPTAP